MIGLLQAVNHFCIEILKVSNSYQLETYSKPILHSVIASPMVQMSVELKLQCVHFEKKQCFALVDLNQYPVCFYNSTLQSQIMKLFTIF